MHSILVVLQVVPLGLLLVMMKLLLVLLTVVLELAILEMLKVIGGVAGEEIVLQTTFQPAVLVSRFGCGCASRFGCCCDGSLCGCGP